MFTLPQPGEATSAAEAAALYWAHTLDPDNKLNVKPAYERPERRRIERLRAAGLTMDTLTTFVAALTVNIQTNYDEAAGYGINAGEIVQTFGDGGCGRILTRSAQEAQPPFDPRGLFPQEASSKIVGDTAEAGILGREQIWPPIPQGVDSERPEA